MIGKEINRDGHSVPGPGTYTIKEGPHGPQFSITGVKENPALFKGRYQSPGPGSYKLNDELDVRMRGGRFSSSKRPERKVSLDPGPGQYSQEDRFLHTSPSFTLKGKFPDKKPDVSPGPGHYDPRPVFKRSRRKIHLYRNRSKTDNRGVKG